MRFLLFSLLFSLLSLACTSEPTAPVPEPVEPEVIPEISFDDRLLLDLTNDLRTAGCTCGNEVMPPVAPLSWNERVDTAAARHAADMHRHEELSHTGSNGSDTGDRLVAAGYDWRAYAENVAYNYPDVEAVFQGWKTSPGHCRNLMNRDVREMGFARSGAYWAQVFAARSGEL